MPDRQRSVLAPRRRGFLAGLLTVGLAGCLDESGLEPDGDPPNDADPPVDADGDGGDGGFAGGRATPTTTDPGGFPLVDKQHIAIRDRLNDRRVEENRGELEVQGDRAARLRRLAGDHADTMAAETRVGMDVGGSLVETVESEFGTCYVQTGDGRRYSGPEVVFLGHVGVQYIDDPSRAAQEFLGHWFEDTDT